jgi:signal peptidase complex subunit 1
LIGFSTQDIHRTLYVGLGGTALTFFIVVPPWPFFNQNPLPWLPHKVPPKTYGSGQRVDLSGLQGVNIEVDGKRVG